MSLGRFLPGTRETAEETKRRVWRQHGILVVDLEKIPVSWDDKELLIRIGTRLYGPKEGLQGRVSQ